MPDNVSVALTSFAAGLSYDDLSPAAAAAAKRVTLDAIGVMAAASGLCAEVAPFVRQSIALGSGGRCTILGATQPVSAPMAALANGAMAHALDYEDVFDAAPCHPNAAAIPAGLAIAQDIGTVAGRDFLAAVAAGCDVVCRMALAVRDSLEQPAWYPPPMLGAHGAAIVASKLLGGGAGQLRDTLSLCMMQNNAPGEIRYDGATVLRATREAFPACAAVSAAMLAAAGVRGFADPLGGQGGFFRQFADGRYDAGALVRDRSLPLYIEGLSFKRWPTCRGTHAAIEMALMLPGREAFDWREVERVDVAVSPLQQMLAEPLPRKRQPSTLIDAKFSIPFTTAIAFVHGAVTIGELQPTILRDEDVLGFARRVRVRIRPEWGPDKGAAAEMKIRLASGRSVECACPEPAGGMAAPLTDTALEQKFLENLSCSANPPAESVAREVAERLFHVEDEADVGALLARLYPAD